MTIDKIIKRETEIAVKFQKAVDTHKASDDGFCKSLADYHKQIADTMRKYQKIQSIAEKCNLKLLPKEAMSTFMKDVLEILEDGNAD